MAAVTNQLLQAPAASAHAAHSAPSGLAAVALPAPSGGSFKDALEQRLPLLLARTAGDAQTDDRLRARTRLIEAAAVVRTHGMPLRHQAARTALATAAGCYDWYFREPTWTLAPSGPAQALTWVRPGGSVVVDLCSCDPLAAAAGPSFAFRAAAVWQWAADTNTALSLVRLLQLTAPTTACAMTSAVVRLPLAQVAALADASAAAADAAARPARVQVAS